MIGVSLAARRGICDRPPPATSTPRSSPAPRASHSPPRISSRPAPRGTAGKHRKPARHRRQDDPLAASTASKASRPDRACASNRGHGRRQCMSSSARQKGLDGPCSPLVHFRVVRVRFSFVGKIARRSSGRHYANRFRRRAKASKPTAHAMRSASVEGSGTTVMGEDNAYIRSNLLSMSTVPS
jgi:hypothetical protein